MTVLTHSHKAAGTGGGGINVPDLTRSDRNSPAAAKPLLRALTPSQVDRAYGFNALPNQGQGTTVAIVVAYKDPKIAADLATFSAQYNLPKMDGVVGNPKFTEATPTGQAASPLPPPVWTKEAALDVEWVHAAAPKANILLVECQGDSNADLYGPTPANAAKLSGVAYAKAQTNVVVVSNSYGRPYTHGNHNGEFAAETTYDATFAQPGGNHPNVVIDYSTGDFGDPGAYPAFSPAVTAVGGTELNLATAAGKYGFETGWSGGGGGVSSFEPTPAFQSNYGVKNAHRSIPDVSLDGSPASGVSVYDSYASDGWTSLAGTSLSAPLFSGLIAFVDSTRLTNGKTTLTTSVLNNALYQAYASVAYTAYFHDITQGDNGNAAGVGYDLVTGLGSPNNPAMYQYLVGAGLI